MISRLLIWRFSDSLICDRPFFCRQPYAVRPAMPAARRSKVEGSGTGEAKVKEVIDPSTPNANESKFTPKNGKNRDRSGGVNGSASLLNARPVKSLRPIWKLVGITPATLGPDGITLRK